MSLAAIVEALVEAGATPQMIAAAVRAAEMSGAARSKHAEAQARYRAKAKAEEQSPVITSDHADHGDHVCDEKTSPLKRSPITPKNTPPSKTSLRSDTSACAESFSRFWLAYPRKTERKAAEAKFVALVKSGVDPEAIIAGAHRYAGSNPEPKFTKHQTTWLNRGCWDDEQLPRDGPRKPQGSVLARMATGEYWDDFDEQQPNHGDHLREASGSADQSASGFAGRMPERSGDDAGGTLLDFRSAGSGWR